MLPVTIAIIVPTLVASIGRTRAEARLRPDLGERLTRAPTSTPGSTSSRNADAHVQLKPEIHADRHRARNLLEPGLGHLCRAPASSSDSNVAGKYVKLLTGSTTYSHRRLRQVRAALDPDRACSWPVPRRLIAVRKLCLAGRGGGLLRPGADGAHLPPCLFDRLRRTGSPSVTDARTTAARRAVGQHRRVLHVAPDGGAGQLAGGHARDLPGLDAVCGRNQGVEGALRRDGGAAPSGADGSAQPAVPGRSPTAAATAIRRGWATAVVDRAPIQIANGHPAGHAVAHRDHPQTAADPARQRREHGLAGLTAAPRWLRLPPPTPGRRAPRIWTSSRPPEQAPSSRLRRRT